MVPAFGMEEIIRQAFRGMQKAWRYANCEPHRLRMGIVDQEPALELSRRFPPAKARVYFYSNSQCQACPYSIQSGSYNYISDRTTSLNSGATPRDPTLFLLPR
jgi:hypothetical protein